MKSRKKWFWLACDFDGKMKIIQVYARYDVANKMQIEQHWVFQ